MGRHWHPQTPMTIGCSRFPRTIAYAKFETESRPLSTVKTHLNPACLSVLRGRKRPLVIPAAGTGECSATIIKQHHKRVDAEQSKLPAHQLHARPFRRYRPRNAEAFARLLAAKSGHRFGWTISQCRRVNTCEFTKFIGMKTLNKLQHRRSQLDIYSSNSGDSMEIPTPGVFC
jgi:hypothetical protein